jgi:hypothetical protein
MPRLACGRALHDLFNSTYLYYFMCENIYNLKDCPWPHSDSPSLTRSYKILCWATHTYHKTYIKREKVDRWWLVHKPLHAFGLLKIHKLVQIVFIHHPFWGLIPTLHRYNNCTTPSHMGWALHTEPHLHVRRCCVIVVVML